MSMIKRKITEYLEDFYKAPGNGALLVTGARQIGKTYSIREYGRRSFSCFIEFNLLEDRNAYEAFRTSKNAEDLLLRISALSDKELVPGETLIFIDEIQVLPDALTFIKFLVEDGRYRYILSGSLLGVELKSIRSLPVGSLTVKEMYPLNLEEFFLACGVREETIKLLSSSFEERIPVDEMVHEKMMALFRLYLIVGGMPAAVLMYLETNDIRRVMEKQREIIELYKLDISRYDIDSKLYIEDIFKIIPSELNNPNKRFILKNMNEKARFKQFESSFLWLSGAGVAIPVYNVDSPTVPLELSKSRNLFKLFSNDVGLLACQYADGIQIRILNGDKDINNGSVYENAVAEELLSHGIDLYYFNSKKQGELDFVIKIGDHVLPIEVKSGKNYVRHNALSNVMEDEGYGIPEAFVLTNDNVKCRRRITYLPIYMSMFIKEKELEKLVYKVDLSGL